MQRRAIWRSWRSVPACKGKCRWGHSRSGHACHRSKKPSASSHGSKLLSRRSRELAAGTTLYGPHRDDLRFLANGHDLRTYGSRGQQRTAALALKLAEVQAMQDETGEAPLLLLDDVMSELDAHRRATLLTALAGVNQAVLTTTDWADFSPDFREKAQLLTVQDGTLRPEDH